jgi:hypothetical protein
MKQFLTLVDAFNYQLQCPICKCDLEIKDKDLNTILDSDCKLVLENSSSGPIIIVDRDSEKIEVLQRHKNQSAPTGIYYFGTKIISSCAMYEYIIQLRIDLTNNKILQIFLNSEFFAFEEDIIAYELRNVYTLNRTEVTYYKGNVDTKSINLPLLPVDHSNPLKFLERAKNLIIFS